MSSRAVSNGQARLRAFNLQPEFRQVALVVAVSGAIILPAVFFGIPSNRDLTNHFRFALPFYDAVTSGDLHPGWLAESNGGYGDASFRVYPPALYYLLTVVRATTGNWYGATVITFALLFVAGALGVYLWTKSLFDSRVGMWAAIVFTLAPYHLNQFYQASLLAEFAACSVLPFTLWFVERTCQKQSTTNIAGLALTYALLILTHLPLAVLGSLALLVYALCRLHAGRRKQQILSLTSATVLGLLLSSFYWVAMVAEKNWIRADQIQRESSVDYRLNFLFSTFSPDNLNVWWMNILTLSSALLFAPALILLWRRYRQGVTNQLRAIVILLAFVLVMATQLALPIWKAVKPLQETQFPWRWLGIFSMVGAVVAAASLPTWFGIARSKLRPLFLIAISGMLMSITFSLSHIVREAKFLSAPVFASTLNDVRGSEGVGQWLPVTAKDHVAAMNGEIELAGRQFQTVSRSPEKRIFSVSAGAAGEARVHTYYYPHWRAFVGQQQLPVRPADDGVLLVSVPAEATTITVEFIEPLRTRVSTIISVVALLGVASLIFFGRREVFSNG
ncbi:MAG TPA: 6-pyruvoyl-tetrahydropterin synthase-related protein [Pyrinomonadaceae bacterium]|nr:6-pyruvoyl-tetrahydropterin synthase-related protein [Pyrinomonadaceae bacterium]